MKAFILGCLTLAYTQIHAQTMVNKPIVCMDTQGLVRAISSNEIGEKPHWLGNADTEDSNFVLFVNPKTKSWTLVQLNEKVACILGTGSKSTDAQYTPAKRQM